jgi:hypothetical protein
MGEHKFCKFCKRWMDVSDESYAQNPYCARCYHDRLRITSKEAPLLAWKRDGDYVIPVRAPKGDE